jgi:hypothetical protein
MTSADALFWALFPVGFVGLWLLVGFAVSRGGWHRFASRHPAPSRTPGRCHTAPWASFGSVFSSYRNVVRVVFTDAGIHVHALFLFRAFHRPFLVPWTSVRRVERQDRVRFRGYRIDVEDVAGEIHLLLPVAVEDDLRAHHQAG